MERIQGCEERGMNKGIEINRRKEGGEKRGKNNMERTKEGRNKASEKTRMQIRGKERKETRDQEGKNKRGRGEKCNNEGEGRAKGNEN